MKTRLCGINIFTSVNVYVVYQFILVAMYKTINLFILHCVYICIIQRDKTPSLFVSFQQKLFSF